MGPIIGRVIQILRMPRSSVMKSPPARESPSVVKGLLFFLVADTCVLNQVRVAARASSFLSLCETRKIMGRNPNFHVQMHVALLDKRTYPYSALGTVKRERVSRNS